MPKTVPGRSIRDVQKEYTKELLVRSAHDLFVENGYANTTIDQIAARAGTSRATFYLHFQRKWETVRHIAERELQSESLDYYRRLDKFGVPTKEQMRSWLEDAFGFYKRHSKFMIVFRQAYSLEPDISKYQFETLAKCVAVMPNYLKRWGPKRETEARLRLNLLTIQLSDIATRLLQGDIDLDRDELIDVLLEYWMVGLKDPGPVKPLRRMSTRTKRPSPN
jgi:AcrR family transcriptional regulator